MIVGSVEEDDKVLKVSFEVVVSSRVLEGRVDVSVVVSDILVVVVVVKFATFSGK